MASHPPFDPLGLEGTTIDERYQLDRFVTAGGIACVYKGIDLSASRVVAIKVLDTRTDDSARTRELRERFQREAEACTHLVCPNTVRMFAHGVTEEGYDYMVLEWIEGETLHERMRRVGAARPLTLIRIMKQLCEALAEAHAAGIVHRDLKPGNVLLVPAEGGGDFAKLLDFGLAKHLDAETTLTRADSVLGTPTYMSPEQIEGAATVDNRTDIYSLGVVMYRGLTNKRPFGGKHPTMVMQGHLRKPVPSMSTIAPEVEVPRNVEWIVRTCMNKAREDRFASVKELRMSLRACELELLGKLPGLTLALVDGRLDVPKDVRQRLARDFDDPAPTPAPAEPRPAQKNMDVMVPLVLIGAAGGLMGLFAMLAWLLLL